MHRAALQWTLRLLGMEQSADHQNTARHNSSDQDALDNSGRKSTEGMKQNVKARGYEIPYAIQRNHMQLRIPAWGQPEQHIRRMCGECFNRAYQKSDFAL